MLWNHHAKMDHQQFLPDIADKSVLYQTKSSRSFHKIYVGNAKEQVIHIHHGIWDNVHRQFVFLLYLEKIQQSRKL